MFAWNSYSMELCEPIQRNHTLDKALILSKIVVHQDFLFFDKFSLQESLGTVSALAYVNKQCNKVCKDPIFTKKFMRYVTDKHSVYEGDIVRKLRTFGARRYCELSEKLFRVRSDDLSIDDIKTWIKDGADVRYRKSEKVWCKVGFVECPLLFPLSNAVAYNLTKVVQLLLTHGADARCYGATLLNMAITHSNEEIVKMLLSHGVVIDNPSDGISSVARAVCHGNVSILETFFEYGINFNSLVDDCFGKNYPLFIAAYRMRCELVIFLLEHGVVAGARQAFDSAKSSRRNLCVNNFLCRGLSREEAIEEVQKIDTVMKALLLKKEFILTDQDVQKALNRKDKNLLRLYCECDESIDTSHILTIYPDLFESCYT